MDRYLAQRCRESARRYRDELGISTFPMGTHDKRPAVKWSEWRDRLPTDEDLDNWGNCNVGIITGRFSGIVVIDCDTLEDARWFRDTFQVRTAHVRTARGIHFFFRWPASFEVRNAHGVTFDGIPRFDVRGEGGYVVGPPSYFKGHQYHFLSQIVDVSTLPDFRAEWLPAKGGDSDYTDKTCKDGAAYIAMIRATSGHGGHNATWRAVNYLKRSGLGETEAFAILAEWNKTNADPPWSNRELLHKVLDCYRS